MKVIHHIIYPALAGLLFLIGHILIISLELGMELNLLFIVGSMILCQLLVYFIAGKGFLVERFAFRQIFQILAITQFFSIAFLTIFSAYDPFEEPKKVLFTEVIVSFLIFAVLLPLLLTGSVLAVRSIFPKGMM
ncbi:hypothetical protein [Daejeonella sp. H1SJ63]|uniref:hypothetical protein n=1 Tax=Daejeonella sp. H1SJ63 TaxID=3034145 RepID=UPI0023EB2F79|nr:hypothetical protein [Daejeonella sp. H1SJ63]